VKVGVVVGEQSTERGASSGGGAHGLEPTDEAGANTRDGDTDGGALAQLLATAKRFSAAVTVREVAAVALDRAIDVPGVLAAVFVLHEGWEGRLTAIGARGRSSDWLGTDNDASRHARGILVEAVATATSHAWDGVAAVGGAREATDVGGAGGTLMALPLLANGRVSGVLGLEFSGHEAFTAGRRTALHALVEHAAIALERARHAGDLGDEREHAAHDTPVGERETFLATIAHDLKNPLTVIRAQAQIAHLQLAHPDRDLPALRQRLTTIIATADRFKAMLDRMVDGARLAAGRPLDLDRQPVELVALVTRVMAMNHTAATPEPVTLVAAPAQLRVAIDRPRFERALDSVFALVKAITPEGEPHTVALSCEPLAGEQWVWLRLHGAGVVGPDAELGTVFGYPRRDVGDAERVPKLVAEFMDARQIVAAHGGTIVAESGEGRGTDITIRLPLAANMVEEWGE